MGSPQVTSQGAYREFHDSMERAGALLDLRQKWAAAEDLDERRRLGVEMAQKEAVLRLKMERNARR